MRSLLKRIKNESGQSAILLALAMVVLCGVVGIVVDTGTVAVEKGQLQTAADAAALAAAHDLPSANTARNTAERYAQANGVDSTNVSTTTPYNGDAKKVEVICSETVEYTFARVLGFTSTVVSARAVAQKTGMSGGAFGYAIFSGSENSRLGLHSSSLNVTGSIHSNDEIMMNGSSQTINGNAEAVNSYAAHGSSITVTGTVQASSITAHGSNINIPNRYSVASPVIDMPDFSGNILAEAEASGTKYTGDKLFNGSGISVDSSIYVDGRVTVAGSTFSGTGVLLATGNIQLNGSCIEQSSSTSVCIYSKNGDIQINGSNIRIDGVLYAPNGFIQINGSNIVVNGRVIGKEVQLNGSSITVNSGSGDLGFLPEENVSLIE